MDADDDDTRMDLERNEVEEGSPPPSDEGEGEGVMSDDEHDSSEESEEDDPEEARRIAEGFIVDDSAERSRHRSEKRKKHKKHRRRGSNDLGALDEDDLDLLEQNTGVVRERPDAPKKLVRHRDEDEADDEDRDRAGPSLTDIFADDTVRQFEDDDDDEMAGFIEEDEEDEEARPAAQREKAPKSTFRPSRSGFGGAASGLSRETWEEIQEIFGTGADYEWAMQADDEGDAQKGELKLEDIYEPTEIAERMMTQADEEIRMLDMPERLQIATASLDNSLRGADALEPLLVPILAEHELNDATEWVAPRVSNKLSAAFLIQLEGGYAHPLRDTFMMAVRNALDQICHRFLEPPFVWLHRRDFFVHYDPQNPDPRLQYCDLLGRNHLWTIQTLGIRYRSFLDRRQALRNLWTSLQEPEDAAFEDAFARLDGVEEVADLTEWVNTRYIRELRRLKEVAAEEEGEDAISQGGVKRAQRETRYSRIRNTGIYTLAQSLGTAPSLVDQDFAVGIRRHFVDDPPGRPADYAQTWVDPDNPQLASVAIVLDAANFATVYELAHLPALKRAIRRGFRDHGLLTVVPTEQGTNKIDQLNPAFAFKYLKDKPVRELLNSPLFLQIVDAERNGDITYTLSLEPTVRDALVQDLRRVYLSDFTSEDAEAWNALRRELIDRAVDEHLLPFGARWLRDHLVEEVQEHIGRRCGDELLKRVDVAPYMNASMEKGQVPNVVAISHGAGDFKRDSVHVVFLDSEGHLREQFHVDNLRVTNPRNPMGDEYRERLLELCVRRRPQVVVMGGTTPMTHRLTQDVLGIVAQAIPKIAEELLTEKDDDGDTIYKTGDAAGRAAQIDTIYVNDEVARIYQHSKRAKAEYAELATTGKYCVALARYVQSPVTEYAAVGKDILALTFDPAQKYLDETILMTHLDRAIVNAVNTVGVDVNRAAREPYHAFLLPYVAGLGPRKAQRLVTRVNAIGGTLASRYALVTSKIMGEIVFMNCSAFLRIDHQDLPDKLLESTGDAAPDILDTTRIHPEDYDIARKMAADAEELDEEDLADLSHPSQVVSKLLEGDPRKLDDLSLDDFAVELQRLLSVPKRLTLYLIRDELKQPFRESRDPLRALAENAIFTQLTGETRQTLELGLIIPVVLMRFLPSRRLLVRLDSGIEGTIENGYWNDEPEQMTDPASIFHQGQTISARVLEIKQAEFAVVLDCRPAQLAAGDLMYRRVPHDEQHWDVEREQADTVRAETARKKAGNRSMRTIQHPYFHNFSFRQAEEYLSTQPRGECVVRPSSRGIDHLAVTWKVDTDCYQHFDVLEMDKPNEYELGRSLKVGTYKYSDLDELVFSHVKGMARKVEEMLLHDKFKGDEEQCLQFCKNYQLANPTKSIYAFALNRKQPGQFSLIFITTKGAPPKTWPVIVEPDYFKLFDGKLPDVTQLCNAFKVQYTSSIAQRILSAAPPAANQGGARLPYGNAPNGGGYNAGYNQYPAPSNGYGQAAYPPQASYGQPATYGAAYR